MTGKLTEKRIENRFAASTAAQAASLIATLPRLPTSSLPRAASGSFIAAKAVGSFVPALTRKAFEKFGFATATLITDWAQIVGAEVACWSAPERLKWPRGPQAADEADAEGRPGATLVLRVDPARALEVEYRSRQIVERINAYFGYRAVSKLRFIQSPLPKTQWPSPRVRQLPPSAPELSLDPLTRALARLERGVRAAAQRA